MKKLITLFFISITFNCISQNSTQLIPIEPLNLKELRFCSNKDYIDGPRGRQYDSQNFIKYSYIQNEDFNKEEIETLFTNCYDSLNDNLKYCKPVNKISRKKISLDTTTTTSIRFQPSWDYNSVYFVNIEGLGDVFLIQSYDRNPFGFAVTVVEKEKLILIDKSIKAKIRYEDSLEVIKIVGAERGNEILSKNDDSKTALILAKTLKKRLDYEKFQSKLNEFLSFKISFPEFKKQYRNARDSVSEKQFQGLRQQVTDAIDLAEKNFISDHHIVIETDFENEKSKVFVYSDDNWSSAFDEEGRHLATDSIYGSGIPQNIIQFIPKHKSYYKPLESDILQIKCNNVQVQVVINDTLYKVNNYINYRSDTAFSKKRFRDNFIHTYYGDKSSKAEDIAFYSYLKRLLIWDNKFQLNSKNGVEFEISSERISEEYSYAISYSLDQLYDSYLKMHKVAKKEQAIRKAQREEEEKLAEAERLAQKQKLYSKYGKKYVDAAYDFEFIVGMHEDLANIIVQQLWDVHSKDQLGDGSIRYWLIPNSSVGTKRVIITIKNKKITRVSSW
tara:strand:- start:9735 stop:11408 length:1674 start_codon:yes stop_codon:yes gene_type:complete